MLNCTKRKQMEPVFTKFVELYPTPELLSKCDVGSLACLLKPLGFQNRRSRALIKLATEYLKPGWKTAQELPSIGEYAARAWSIFVKNELGVEQPNDGALMIYHRWRLTNENS